MADKHSRKKGAVWPAGESSTDPVSQKALEANSVQLNVPPTTPSKAEQGAGSSSSITGLTTWQLIRIAFIWLGSSCCSDFLFFEGIPSQVRSIVGDEKKDWALSTVVLTSAVVTLLAGPLIGIYSDRTTLSFGRRRPYLLAGGLLTFVIMIFVAASNPHLPPETKTLSAANCTSIEEARHSQETQIDPETQALLVQLRTYGSIVVYVLLQLVVSLAFALVEVPFNGLVADKVAPSGRGFASSVIGVMAITGGMLGMVIGLFYRELGVFGSFILVGFIMWLSTMIGCTVSEEKFVPSNEQQATLNLKEAVKSFFKPFRDSDFRWLFITRFLFMMGVATMGSFLQYWLYEVVTLPEGISPERGVAILAIALTLTGLPCAFVAGVLSDKLGCKRKIFVFFSGLLLACGSIAYTFVTDFYLIVAFTVMSGVGFGVYLSVDYALALDVLADSESFALDLAVWHQAEVLPRLLATPIAAVFLQEFHKLEGCTHDRMVGIGCGKRCTLGWVVLWIVVALYFTIATIFVYKIKRAK